MILEQRQTSLVFNSCGFIVFWVVFSLSSAVYIRVLKKKKKAESRLLY